MDFQVIYTGSDGNCSVLRDGNNAILIDAGFRTKKLMDEKLNPVFSACGIHGIIITHEHTDHFSTWTGRLAIEKNIPLYLHPRHYENEPNRKTKYLSYEDKRAGVSHKAEVVDIKEDVEFVIDGFRILPFTAYHDANKTLGFVINEKFGYLADCGFISNNIKEKLKGVETLALEFNYEIDKLISSDRHWSNKIRTFGKFGHLSNEEAIKFCKWLKKNGKLKKVITLHPSNAHNNLNMLESKLSELGIEFYVSQREGNGEVSI